MVWLLLIFGAAVLSIFKRETFPTSGLLQESKKPPPFNIGALDFTDPEALAHAAKVAKEAGYAESAKALASKAQDVGDIAQAINGNASLPITSPIPGVNDARWTAFVNLFRGKNINEISPAYHLGLFNVGFHRLRDLGLAFDVKQELYNGKPVWKGAFKPPMTLEKFLNNPTVQYKVFAKDMADRAAFLRQHFKDQIGQPIEGAPASLSGLLAAIKLAGTKGFGSWVKDPEERRKFANTTAAYKMANGIF